MRSRLFTDSPRRLVAAILAFNLWLAAAGSALADPASCIRDRVWRLIQARQFVSQMDPRLVEAGLHSRSGRSRLCGSACATFLEQTVLSLVNQRLSPAELVNQYSYWVGQMDSTLPRPKPGQPPMTVREGVSAPPLTQGMRVTLAKRRIVAKVQSWGVQPSKGSTKFDHPEHKFKPSDLGSPPGQTRLALVLFNQIAKPPKTGNWSHWLYLFDYDPKTGDALFVEPNNPGGVVKAKVEKVPNPSGNLTMRLNFIGYEGTFLDSKNNTNFVTGMVSVDLPNNWLAQFNRDFLP